MSKCSGLLLVFVLATSVLIVNGLVSAVSKPSVPEFTAKMVDHSYDVPLTKTNYTNPYTGQQETKTSGGYHVENITIDVTIKNQPFTPSTIDGNTTGLFYVIRWKGHFENWTDYGALNDVAYENSYPDISYAVPAAAADYTVKSYSISSLGSIPQGGLVDFQVKAQIGFSFLYFGGHIQPIGTSYHWVEESDWSSIQTVTVGEGTPSATPDPSPPLQSTAPSQNLSPDASLSQSDAKTAGWLGLEWIWVAVFGVVAVLAGFTVLFLLKKRR